MQVLGEGYLSCFNSKSLLRPTNLCTAFCIHLRGEHRCGSFCPFPLSLCQVSQKLSSLFAVLEKSLSMGQVTEADDGWGSFVLVSSFLDRRKSECESLTIDSFTSLGDTLTEKEQQQHTRFEQIILKREK